MNQRQLDEYNVVRNAVGLFDLSSNAKIYISGKESLIFLNRLISGNLEAMYDGKIINTLFMRDNGSILAIVWVMKDANKYLVLSDTEKRDIILKWLIKNSEGYDVQIEDRTDILGSVALIGPKAQKLTREIAGDDIIGLPYLGFEHNTITDCLLCRIGYTGEYEYRFIIPKEKCDNFKSQIMERGRAYGIAYCDTEVIDTLMLEMKSINQKRDILEDTTPIQAGLHWMIDFKKTEFIGRNIIMLEKRSPAKKLLTLLSEDRIDIPEMGRLFIENTAVGFIVNKSFSPTLERNIYLAYIDERFAWVGINFAVEGVNDNMMEVKTVSSPLFITKSVREGAF